MKKCQILNSLSCSGPSGENTLGFLGLGKGKAALAQDDVSAQVQATYQYPPKSCADAYIILAKIEKQLTITQENIAIGATSAVGQRYLQAYTNVKRQFSDWLAAKNCEQTAAEANQSQFWGQVTSTLEAEKSDTNSTSNTDNLVVFGVLAVLAAGALYIILKKRNK